MIVFCQKVSLANCLNFCWILFSFIVIFTFALSAVMVLINIIAFDGCEIIDKSLNENGYFPKLKINSGNIDEFY